MKPEELKKILHEHAVWLKNPDRGKRADLCEANLCEAKLCEANLCEADLQRTDLHGADIRGADLYGANLSGASLYGADLRRADLWRSALCDADLRRANFREACLREVNLYGADLRGTNLCGADLRGANLDFSSGLPFHCGGTKARGDSRLFAQIVYHLTRQDWSACTKKEKDWLKSIPQEIVNSFYEYRKDVDKI